MNLLPQTSKSDNMSTSSSAFAGLFLPNLSATPPSPTSQLSSASSPVSSNQTSFQSSSSSSAQFINNLIMQKTNIDCSPFKIASSKSFSLFPKGNSTNMGSSSSLSSGSFGDLNKKFSIDMASQKSLFYSQLMAFLQQQHHQQQQLYQQTLPIQPQQQSFQALDHSKLKPHFADIVS